MVTSGDLPTEEEKAGFYNVLIERSLLLTRTVSFFPSVLQLKLCQRGQADRGLTKPRAT